MANNNKDVLKNKFASLLNVKSIITIILSCVFAFGFCTGIIDSQSFLHIFTMVISFYFGVQTEKNNNKS